MKRKTIVGVVLAAAMVVMLGAMIIDMDTDKMNDDGMESIDYNGSNTEGAFSDTLNYALFEEYGPVLIIVTLMLFGAIIGAATIAKEEEDDEDDSN